MSEQNTFSSIPYLTREALSAAISEQTENALQPGNAEEYSEWNQIETDHVVDLIVASPEMLTKIAVALDAIEMSFWNEDRSRMLATVAVVTADAIRIGWHTRAAIWDGPWFHNLYQKELADADAVEAWRWSICEMDNGQC